MQLVKLFYNFFIVGLFSFGGSYSVIPLIRDMDETVLSLSESELSDVIAISESTPGPVAINLATYIGAKNAGLLGAFVSTTAVVLPAFIIIILFVLFLEKFFNKKKVKFVLSIVRVCAITIIFYVGLNMLFNVISYSEMAHHISVVEYINPDPIYASYHKAVQKRELIFIILITIMLIYKFLLKKKVSSILLIILGGILGIVMNAIL